MSLIVRKIVIVCLCISVVHNRLSLMKPSDISRSGSMHTHYHAPKYISTAGCFLSAQLPFLRSLSSIFFRHVCDVRVFIWCICLQSRNYFFFLRSFAISMMNWKYLLRIVFYAPYENKNNIIFFSEIHKNCAFDFYYTSQDMEGNVKRFYIIFCFVSLFDDRNKKWSIKKMTCDKEENKQHQQLQQYAAK